MSLFESRRRIKADAERKKAMKFKVELKDPTIAGIWVDTVVRNNEVMAVVLLHVKIPPVEMKIAYWPVSSLTVTHFKDGNEWRLIDQLL